MDDASYRIAKKMAAAIRPLRKQLMENPNTAFLVKNLEDQIRRHRIQQSPGTDSVLREIKDRTKIQASTIIDRMRDRRIFVTVNVGKDVSGKVGKHGIKTIEVNVPWTWLRKVLPIYQKGFTDKNQFILKADEYNTNHKEIRLWEVWHIDISNGTILRSYLSMSGYGKPKFKLTGTANAAVKAAFNENQKQITKRLTGED